jgi:hypothetical protein
MSASSVAACHAVAQQPAVQKPNGSGWFCNIRCIYDQHIASAAQKAGKMESKRATLNCAHPGWSGCIRSQATHNMYSDAIIGKQGVAQPQNQNVVGSRCAHVDI